MSKFQQFIENIPNQAVEVSDKSNIYQCMDFAYLWVFILGFPKATIQHLYAYEAFTKASELTKKYFEVIQNTPEFIPKQGDIGVFGTEVGIAGHICVIDDGCTQSKIISWDQNWAGVQRVTKVTHTYGGKNGFLGVLRPRWELVDSCLIAKNNDGSKLFEKLVHNSGVADETVRYLGLADKADNTSFNTIKNSLEARDGKLTTCKTELSTRDSELAAAKKEIENRIEQISRVTDSLTSKVNDWKERYTILKSTQSSTEEIEKTYQTRIEQLQSKLNDEAKAKGRALTELAEVKAKLESAEKEQFSDLTFAKWISLLSTIKWF